MKSEIIAVGTELLLGEILDTNSQYLAQQLTGLGIDLFFVTHVGDNMGRLTETVQRALDRSDVVIMTGGLGPTEDDLTVVLQETAAIEGNRVEPRMIESAASALDLIRLRPKRFRWYGTR